MQRENQSNASWGRSVTTTKPTVENVGNVAINDSFLLESCIYKLLKKYFKGEKYYADLIELLHETTYQVNKYKQREKIIERGRHRKKKKERKKEWEIEIEVKKKKDR